MESLRASLRAAKRDPAHARSYLERQTLITLAQQEDALKMALGPMLHGLR